MIKPSVEKVEVRISFRSASDQLAAFLEDLKLMWAVGVGPPERHVACKRLLKGARNRVLQSYVWSVVPACSYPRS